jgi:phosphoribosyl 1,2-cyclic phosphodiesterase
MKIELWGVRGSLPTPLTNQEYQSRVRDVLNRAIQLNVREDQIDDFLDSLPIYESHLFGGNTTCVTVTTNSGQLYILDAGTGIRPLGDKLLEEKKALGDGILNILLTHTHWDHIQGLPFFKPLYIEGNTINFYSQMKDLQERLDYQQKFRFFPVEFNKTASTKFFTQLKGEEVIEADDGLQIDMMPLKHPGGSCAYRFRQQGKTFIFCTDVEIEGSTVESYTPEYDSFFSEADLLIIDSQYTLDEAFLKFDWGHTSYTMAVNCGIRWNVNKLVLTHHEPSYDDQKLAEIYSLAVNHKKEHAVHSGSNPPEIIMAVEGQTFEL